MARVGYQEGRRVVIAAVKAMFEAPDEGLMLKSVRPRAELRGDLENTSPEPIAGEYTATPAPTEREVGIFKKLGPEGAGSPGFK